MLDEAHVWESIGLYGFNQGHMGIFLQYVITCMVAGIKIWRKNA